MMATKKNTEEKIKLPESWEEFCQQTNRNPNALSDVSMYEEKHKRHAIADFKLTLVIEHCNGGPLDYKDGSTKYEPWFQIISDPAKPSGLGLRFNGYDGWNANTICGPRFAFKTIKILLHVVKFFIEEYCDLHL